MLSKTQTQPIQPIVSSTQAPVSPSHSFSSTHIAIGTASIVLPLIGIIAAIAYRKHRKKALHQQQIEILERLWKINYNKTNS